MKFACHSTIVITRYEAGIAEKHRSRVCASLILVPRGRCLGASRLKLVLPDLARPRIKVVRARGERAAASGLALKRFGRSHTHEARA